MTKRVALIFTAAVLLLVGSTPVARADHPPLGGTFNISGTVNYLNFCNTSLRPIGTAYDTITINIIGGEGPGSIAIVSAFRNAPDQSDGTHTCTAIGQATASYTTLAPAGSSYTFPMNAFYRTSASGLSFTAEMNAVVSVGANQQPTGFTAFGVSGSCGGE